jgi:hypothetical protein
LRLNDIESVLDEGTFLDSEGVVCRIRVIRSSVLYGSGDHEDEPEVSQDQDGECFYVEYGSTAEPATFVARSQAFPSLQAALQGAATQLGPARAIRWRGASEA